MKKSLISLTFLALTAGVLAGCGGNPEHVHTFESEWTTNETSHWHKATCGHDVKDSEGNHADGNGDGKCDVCNYQMPKPVDYGDPFGKIHTYSGRFEDFVAKEGTDLGDFIKLIKQIYKNGENQFRGDLVSKLGQYKVESDKNPYKTLYSDKIAIDSKENALNRTFDGKSINTYLINKFETYNLCEFGLDPNVTDKQIYHLYGLVDKASSEVGVYNVINEGRLSSGSPVSIIVHDEGITYSDKDLRLNFYINITVGSNEDPNKKIYEASTAIIYDDGSKVDVQITKQPEDVSVRCPEGFSFSVEVDHPELVLSYRWYAGAFSNGIDGSYSPLDGELASKPTLVMPSIGPEQHEKPFKCLITTKDREFFSDFATLTVENDDDFIECVWICDYPIQVGETLDLSTTTLGTGTITVGKQRNFYVVFEDVHFNNKNMESNLQGLGLTMQTWHNQNETIDLVFVGNNEWVNEYWEEDNHQGGFGFFFHFPVHEEYEVPGVIPTVHMYGDPITFIGGTRAISGDINLIIDNKVTIVGVPERFTSGIYAHSIVVSSGAQITATCGGPVLYTMHSDHNETGTIEIEDGARVSAVISPGKVSVGETMIFGLYAINKLTIHKADVDIIIGIDYAYFELTSQTVMPCIAIYSANSWVYCDHSDVNIKIRAYNVPSQYSVLSNTVEGISALQIELWDSNINIDIDSGTFINVCGINGVLITLKNSKVDVFCHGAYVVSGIASLLSISDPQTGEFIGSLTVTNSKVDVEANADTVVLDEFGHNYYIDAGIRAREFNFTLEGESYIDVKTNRASAFVATFDHADDPVQPEEDYVAKHILFSLLNVVTPDVYIVNQGSYSSWDVDEHNFHVLYEAMYEDKTCSTYVTHVKLVSADK